MSYTTNKTKKLKRSKTYKNGRPRNNQVKRFKVHKPPKKCKCYVCGEIGHFAYKCKNKNVKRDRLNLYESLEINTFPYQDINGPEYDIVSLDGNEEDNDSDIMSYFSITDLEDRLKELEDFNLLI